MPRGIQKAKERVYSEAEFSALDQSFRKALAHIDYLQNKVENNQTIQSLRSSVTNRDFHVNDLENRQQGLEIALATCGNRILSLENNLRNTQTDLESQYAFSTLQNVCSTVGEAAGIKEPSNPPIQPEIPATIKTIKSKPTTKKSTKKKREKK